MAEMPKRIRSVWCREEWFGKGSTGPEPIPMNKRHVGYFSTDAAGTEFIRADLVDELVKALEHARESIELLANMVSDNKQFRQDVSDDLAKIDAALARIKGDVT